MRKSRDLHILAWPVLSEPSPGNAGTGVPGASRLWTGRPGYGNRRRRFPRRVAMPSFPEWRAVPMPSVRATLRYGTSSMVLTNGLRLPSVLASGLGHRSFRFRTPGGPPHPPTLPSKRALSSVPRSGQGPMAQVSLFKPRSARETSVPNRLELDHFDTLLLRHELHEAAVNVSVMPVGTIQVATARASGSAR